MTADDRDELLDAVVGHYEAQLRIHGPTARGMDWKDAASQRLRFELLCGIGDLVGRSVHEVGAGAGHLAGYLAEQGIAAEYSGSDASAAMVAAARAQHPGVDFQQRDLLAGEVEQRYDIVLCSGLFHVKLDRAEDEWREFVQRGLSRMYAMCRTGIGFNLMSDAVDFRSPKLYYADPGQIEAFCRRELSPHVGLRADYPLHEFTTFVYRQTPER